MGVRAHKFSQALLDVIIPVVKGGVSTLLLWGGGANGIRAIKGCKQLQSCCAGLMAHAGAGVSLRMGPGAICLSYLPSGPCLCWVLRSISKVAFSECFLSPHTAMTEGIHQNPESHHSEIPSCSFP